MTWTGLLPWLLMTPFALAFGYAAIHEYRRHRREGPVEDWRETFDFDEEAPSYEHPEETTDAGDEDDQTGAESGAPDATQDRKG